MNNTVLVIIDPQNDFINKAGFYAKKHAGIHQILQARQNITNLLSLNKKEKIVVVFSNYRKDQFEAGLSICIPGTAGHKIDIEIDNTFTLISKDNHSCFSSADFKTYLKENLVDSIILCGFLAEYCVKQTAIDGLKNGYQVSLLQECIGTGDDVQDRKALMLIELAAKGAEILKDNFF